MTQGKRSEIHFAVIEKDQSKLRELLERGVDPDSIDELGFTALHFAAQEWNVEAAKMLIEHGATLSLQDRHGNSALWRATFVSRGRGEMIRLLLEAGADPNQKNRSGVSPVQLAQTIANYKVSQFFS